MRLQEQVYKQSLDALRIVADPVIAGRGGRRGMLQPVQGRLASERRAIGASGRELAGQNRENGVVPQGVVVDEILVAERQAEHPLADQRRNCVLDQLGIARVPEAGCEPLHQPDHAVGDALQLTRAGYRAIVLRPPRASAAASRAGEAPVSTRDRMVDLLRREEGASLPEPMAVTGWLPHTTRAALSRLRSGGAGLSRSKREDGATCYRIVPPAGDAEIAA